MKRDTELTQKEKDIAGELILELMKDIFDIWMNAAYNELKRIIKTKKLNMQTYPKLPTENNKSKDKFPDLDAAMFKNKDSIRQGKTKTFRKFKQTRKGSASGKCNNEDSLLGDI